MGEQSILENLDVKDFTNASKERKPQEPGIRVPSIIRFDTRGTLRLMIYLDAIKQLPSGVCVYPFTVYEDKDKIVVCKDEEKIKIYKMQQEVVY